MDTDTDTDMDTDTDTDASHWAEQQHASVVSAAADAAGLRIFTEWLPKSWDRRCGSKEQTQIWYINASFYSGQSLQGGGRPLLPAPVATLDSHEELP